MKKFQNLGGPFIVIINFRWSLSLCRRQLPADPDELVVGAVIDAHVDELPSWNKL